MHRSLRPHKRHLVANFFLRAEFRRTVRLVRQRFHPRMKQRVDEGGDLNKQTQKEIAEAVQRAKKAYEIATQKFVSGCV
jgi:hypothetical protein